MLFRQPGSPSLVVFSAVMDLFTIVGILPGLKLSGLSISPTYLYTLRYKVVPVVTPDGSVSDKKFNTSASGSKNQSLVPNAISSLSVYVVPHVESGVPVLVLYSWYLYIVPVPSKE